MAAILSWPQCVDLIHIMFSEFTHLELLPATFPRVNAESVSMLGHYREMMNLTFVCSFSPEAVMTCEV